MKRISGLMAIILGLMAMTASAQQTAPKTAPPGATSQTAPKTAPVAASQAPGQAAPQTDDEKRSYAIGVQVAEGIKSQGIQVNSAMVAAGLRDALAGTKLAMTETEIGTAMGGLQREMQAKQEEARTAMLAKNKKDGEAFLAANGKKDGVVSLPSGMQYKVVTAGAGPMPTDDDTVVCNYRGTLLDGKVFDTSEGRGPATFGVKDVIPGFREALKLMTVGSKWQIFVPAELAYGDRGAGNAIEPNATLIFELELVSIQDKK
jgi:FKBP-type peptidyl-prolyl cis-trans isomerase FklB